MTLSELAPWAVIVIGVVLATSIVLVLIRAHRDKESPINLAHLLLETALVPPRITQAKALGLGTWFVSTWWITWLVVESKADSALLIGYMVAWGGVKVAGDLTSIREQESKKDGP